MRTVMKFKKFVAGIVAESGSFESEREVDLEDGAVAFELRGRIVVIAKDEEDARRRALAVLSQVTNDGEPFKASEIVIGEIADVEIELEHAHEVK